jgi:hypothetical protein
MAYVVGMRQKLKVPFWLGEFGANPPFDHSNAELLLAKQLIFRCEEQVVGWNLWMGKTAADEPWNRYLQFFPLEVYNTDEVRQPWQSPAIDVAEYVVDQHGVDLLECYRLEIRENNDFVTLKYGLIVLVIVNHRLANESLEFISEEKIRIAEQLTICNRQFTTDHPGDWNTIVYALERF